jgi:hypothetical protein
MIGTLTDPGARARALTGLVPHLAAGLRDMVFTMAVEITDEVTRAGA